MEEWTGNEQGGRFDADDAGMAGSSPLAYDVPSGISVLGPAELAALPKTELESRFAVLQQMYRQLESENRFLAWEFREFQASFTYFSQALKLAHRLNASDVESIAALAIEEIPAYFHCKFAALFLYDADSRLLRLHSATQKSGRDIAYHSERDAGKFIVRLFFECSEPFVVEYSEETGQMVSDDGAVKVDVPPGWIEKLGAKAMLFPLHVQQPDQDGPLVLGGLVIGDADRDLQVKDAEVSMIFSDLLSSSLYNAMLVQKLNDLTIIEPLTGIYNRRYLINQLNSALVQAQRTSHPLSIAMVDIDNFKVFNDTYGHLGGDEVLKRVASIIKSSIRTEVDIPARYGGEEFLIIMPFTSLDAAVTVGERIRSAIAKHVFLFDGKELAVTCSLGIAQYIDGESPESFIDRADTALYQAKKLGRDQVCFSSSRGPGAHD